MASELSSPPTPHTQDDATAQHAQLHPKPELQQQLRLRVQHLERERHSTRSSVKLLEETLQASFCELKTAKELAAAAEERAEHARERTQKLEADAELRESYVQDLEVAMGGLRVEKARLEKRLVDLEVGVGEGRGSGGASRAGSAGAAGSVEVRGQSAAVGAGSGAVGSGSAVVEPVEGRQREPREKILEQQEEEMANREKKCADLERSWRRELEKLVFANRRLRDRVAELEAGRTAVQAERALR